MKISILALLILSLASTSVGSTERIDDGADSAKAQNFLKLMNAERMLNIGKILPLGILVADRDGKQVDLRSVMHGPVALLKFNPGCPPCVEVFKYAQAHAKQYVEAQGASIAILVVDSKDAGPYVTTGGRLDVYSTTSKLEGSFLAGEITPSVFFLDKDLRLVERRAGLTTPESMLRFPTVQ